MSTDRASDRALRRRTPWFPASVRPVRVGWYEVKSRGWPGARKFFWSGYGWYAWIPRNSMDGRVMFSFYVDARWRGLATRDAAIGSAATPDQQGGSLEP